MTNLQNTIQYDKSEKQNPQSCSLAKITSSVGRQDNILDADQDEALILKGYRQQLQKIKIKAKKILTQEERAKRQNNPDKYFRHQYCGFISSKEHVGINKQTTGEYNYTGVASCGNVWRCPSCALKIQRARAKEIYKISSGEQKTGNLQGFITLTTWHTKRYRLKRSLNNINKKYRNFQNLQFFKRIRKQYFTGQVKVIEITYTNKNGWHPHIHMIFYWKISDREIINTIQQEIIERWAQYSNGKIDAQDQQIVNPVRGDLEKYLTKWDVIQEVTNNFQKSGKGITPFQMLTMITNKILLEGETNIIDSEKKLITLYAEYIEATKGKKRINISDTLLERYKIKEMQDEELAQKKQDGETILQFNYATWLIIYKHNLQVDVLNICYDTLDIKRQKPKILKLLEKHATIELASVDGIATYKKLFPELEEVTTEYHFSKN